MSETPRADKQSPFNDDAQLTPWDAEKHAPMVSLINPTAGGKMGEPILEVCMRTEYFKDRCFPIVAVLKGQAKGGLMDDYRNRLLEAKEHAKQKGDPKFRPRLVVGGGDGTPAFAMLITFRALMARPDRADEPGMADTGNGYIWTDEEFEQFFPAIVQMPLGTGNDLGRVLGWGHKYPGHTTMGGKGAAGKALANFFNTALQVTTAVRAYDVWGFMPPPGQENLDIKVCELAGMDGKTKDLVMKTADPVVPFLVLLYCSFGVSAEVVAKFQLRRTNSQFRNTLQYAQIIPSVLMKKPPPQITRHMEGLTVEDSEGNHYFPPGTKHITGKRYSECGFLNINSFSGGNMSGADRTGCCQRWMCCVKNRKPVSYSDGMMDLYRQRGSRTISKTGTILMTDKKDGAVFSFEAEKGKGMFCQFDGEGRFMFNPEGNKWSIHFERILTIPMVVAPWAEKYEGSEANAAFKFIGDATQVARIKSRVVRWVNGDLVNELNSTAEEITSAGIKVHE